MLLREVGCLEGLLKDSPYRSTKMWNRPVEGITPAEFAAVQRLVALRSQDERSAARDAEIILHEIRASIASGALRGALIERASVSHPDDQKNVVSIHFNTLKRRVKTLFR